MTDKPLVSISKVCSRCKSRQPVAEFNKRARAKDGLRHTCKACDRAIRVHWEQEQAKALPMGPGVESGSVVEDGGLAPLPGPPHPGAALGPSDKVIGHIGIPSTDTTAQRSPQFRIKEVALGPGEDIDNTAAKEYAALLNRKLSVRQRANLMVKIARNAKGPTAALALQALRDINQATGITSKTGAQIELGPLFVLPEGTSMKMKGA